MTSSRRARARAAGLAAVLAAVLVLPGWAQEPEASPTTSAPLPVLSSAVEAAVSPDLVLPAAPDNYRIGDNDVLAVFVFQAPELTRQVMVSSAGAIQLPFLSQPLPVAGLTAPAVSARVASALAAAGLVRDPQVRVVVREVASRPIVVIGAVHTPQTLQASRPMSLVEVISRVGGLTENAGQVAVIEPSGPEPPSSPPQTVALGKLMRGDANVADPILNGNEIVRIPPAEQIFVLGSFKEPGAFPMSSERPISILAAMALAHGVSDPADLKSGQILRRLPDGSMASTPVNISLILQNKLPDPNLQAGDILYVPVNGKKLILTKVLEDAGQAAVVAAGYMVVR